jgi:hypothetical protein
MRRSQARQVPGATERRPVERRHDRQRLTFQRVEYLDVIGGYCRFGRGPVSAARPVLEVVPGAERRPGAGENETADVGGGRFDLGDERREDVGESAPRRATLSIVSRRTRGLG